MSKVLATARQRVLYKVRQLWQQGFATFDSETSGLDSSEDQIIQWAVCDQEGQLLGSGYVKPTVPISEGAFDVHGITDAQLADAPSFAESWPTIHELLAGKTVIIYKALHYVACYQPQGSGHKMHMCIRVTRNCS